MSGRWTAAWVTCALALGVSHADPVFRAQSVAPQVVHVAWDPAAARAATAGGQAFRVPEFPLRADLRVDLELRPFTLFSSDSRVVLGRRGGPDRVLEFDPASVMLFRGRILGREGSDVFLALSANRATGYLSLGPREQRFRVAGTKSQQLVVFPAGPPPAMPPDVPLCGVGRAEAAAPAPQPVLGTSTPRRGLRTLQLAVETDHEFFSLFGDPGEALTYLAAMYGEVSAIYMRDVDTRIELSFVRLWDQPFDLFNNIDPSPLPEFREYWNDYMDAVPRDAAQLLSGRRDYPFGGEAFVSALCGSSAYSVVGYALGFFPDPSRPDPYNFDVAVTAHELGHNAGTRHTHDPLNQVDTCDDPLSSPQRGTIMSYCSQTWSGGNANRDLCFHTVIRQNIETYIGGASCVVEDCNQNGIEDDDDIQQTTSADVNDNGVPDECEDCNDNTILDDVDIAAATSLDVDGNAVPDDCQPDCNGNLIPDSLDIFDATSLDLHGNGIPDECEADCNGNGTSDFGEIQADMTLDLDRDTILDSCQDCDGDGTIDLDALAGSHFAWVASGLDDAPLRQFHAKTGVLSRETGPAVPERVAEAHDLIVTPSGEVLVTSHPEHRVLRFAADGSYLGDIVPPGSAGLDSPGGLALSPDQTTLLVASHGTDNVLAYEATSGAPLGEFVTAGSGGLTAPTGLIFGPEGSLFVASESDEILEFDGQTGAFLRSFVDAAANGGLAQPRGLAFKPDGNLLVASYGTEEVLEFDGADGTPLGKWARVGTATALTQVSPWGVRVGPNGNVFVVRTGEDFGSGGGGHGDHDPAALHLTNAQIYEFDVRNGNFLRTYVGGNDHGMLFPTGFAFAPGWSVDCNVNFLPDSCDIALGNSQDTNRNGTPDECDVDCNANGVQDRRDIIPHGSSRDCNYNAVPDECDLTSGSSPDCNANGIPDDCERDCNGNAVPDDCDIASGASHDCNENGVPDGCDIADDLETDTGWTAGQPGDTASKGTWIRVDPVGTAAQPEDDHTPGTGNLCFVTGQGTPGANNNHDDLDGGFTTLVSRAFDLADDADAVMSYWRWFSNGLGSNPAEDVLQVDISDDGGQNWTPLETVGPTGPGTTGGWCRHSFRVADFVTPGDNVVLRFVAADEGGGSTVEVAIDDVTVDAECCTLPPAAGDLLLARDALTRLSWADAGSGVVYDLVSGALGDLRANQTVATAECQLDDHTGTEWDDPRPDPTTGQAHYFLVRTDSSCGPTSYGPAAGGAPREPQQDCP